MDPKFEFLLKLRVFVIVAASGALLVALQMSGLSRDVGIWIWAPGTVILTGLIFGPPLAKLIGGRRALVFGAILLGLGAAIYLYMVYGRASGRDRTRQCQRQQAPKCTASVKGKTNASAFQAEPPQPPATSCRIWRHQPSDNCLEIEASAQLLGRLKAIEIAENNFVYSGLYRIVLADWNALAELYGANGLTERSRSQQPH